MNQHHLVLALAEEVRRLQEALAPFAVDRWVQKPIDNAPGCAYCDAPTDWQMEGPIEHEADCPVLRARREVWND